MISGTDVVEGGKQAANSLDEHEAPRWLVIVAKAGYSARGLVYVVIGALALLQAFGKGGQKTDTKGAVGSLLEAPGGIFLLWFVAIGLLCYSAWRLCQAFLDADNHGHDTKGVAVRTGLAVSAVTHVFLAVFAAKVAIGSGSSSGGSGGGSKEKAAGTVMDWPGGPWLVGLLGLIVIGVGVTHFVKAYKEKFKEHFDASARTMKWLSPVCRFGLTARGVVFLIIGGFFIYAAVTQDPDKAGGLKEVLNTISQQAFGTILLVITAAGLFAFGFYSISEGVYRKINAPRKLING